jgi:hypothetical protein
MEGLGELIPMAPIRLRVTDGPPPAVLMGPEGEETDLRPSLERLVIDLLPTGCYATITVRADVAEFSFPVVQVFRELETIDLPSAEEIQAAFLSAGMGQSPGAAVLDLIKAHRAG